PPLPGRRASALEAGPSITRIGRGVPPSSRCARERALPTWRPALPVPGMRPPRRIVMTRPQSVFAFVALAAVFAGGLAAVQADDPAAIASEAFAIGTFEPLGGAAPETAVDGAPAAAPAPGGTATDFAAPRGVV